MKQKSEMTEAEESLVELEVEKMLETGLKFKRRKETKPWEVKCREE
jgi:hypothetical protein